MASGVMLAVATRPPPPRVGQNRQLYRDIVRGSVELNNYHVLCRVCHALRYVQDILGVKGHKVTWKGKKVVK